LYYNCANRSYRSGASKGFNKTPFICHVACSDIGSSNRSFELHSSNRSINVQIPMASSTHVGGTDLRHAYTYYVIIRNRVRRIRLQNMCHRICFTSLNLYRNVAIPNNRSHFSSRIVSAYFFVNKRNALSVTRAHGTSNLYCFQNH